MEWYVTAMEEIKRRRGTKKERAILDLWERLGNERKIDSEACKYIIENLLEIYPRLDFNQKHAALELFLKIGDGNEIKNIIFDYFGEIYKEYTRLACRLLNYLYVMRELDHSSESMEHIGPWELDKTFAEVRKRLKEGSSPYL